ncbi:hypothetical protein [Adhaeretor mobilis]|uniref:Uncharacterized protein n=1 Tax=Adhaeretor mobilis TaxID=1930276 RepID=A0A517MZ25_9BACT|nr:hypothetical protein [Adhaeretor mobilis]QDT00068.1 hypothetical protein HG15A2_34030 [Adhaeretor mobilis]
MAIKYATVLALTGMAVVLIRSLRGEASFDTAITEAACWMAFFGVVGCLIGAIAQATIDESVRLQMEKQLAQLDATPSQNA